MTNPSRAKTITVSILSTAIALTTTSASVSAISESGTSVYGSTSSGIVFSAEQNPTELTPQIILAGSGEAVSAETTAAVVSTLNGAVQVCGSAGSEYAASCVSRALKKAASRASNPGYYDARRELKRAAKKLDKLVAKNADKKAPKKSGKYGTYRAVKKESVAAVNKAAVKIIEETKTNLLRSAGNEIRKIHYQRIAQAVGSTKVIFRS